jgi:general secretion pathway protein C
MLKHILTGLQLLLLIWIGYLAWGLVVQWRAPVAETVAAEPAAPGQAANRPPAPKRRGGRQFQIIERRNLFQMPAPKEAADNAIDVAALEQTQLNLKLWGTVSGSSQTAYAIIEDPARRKQHIYHVGDTVQNAEVRMILREKVVLTLDGREELLLMEKTFDDGRPARRKAPAAARSSPAPATAGRPDPMQLIHVNTDLTDAIPREPDLVAQHGNWQPFESDRSEGFRLVAPKGNSIFPKLGIRAGDVLVNFEGLEVLSIEDVAAFLDAVAEDRIGVLEIERRGRRLQIRYEAAEES